MAPYLFFPNLSHCALECHFDYNKQFEPGSKGAQIEISHCFARDTFTRRWKKFTKTIDGWHGWGLLIILTRTPLRLNSHIVLHGAPSLVVGRSSLKQWMEWNY